MTQLPDEKEVAADFSPSNLKNGGVFCDGM